MDKSLQLFWGPPYTGQAYMDMDMDMDGKFHIHGNPGSHSYLLNKAVRKAVFSRPIHVHAIACLVLFTLGSAYVSVISTQR